MPIYEYECEKCHEISEALQHFSDPPLTTCEKCGGPLHKLISKSSFHLKGSGWYADGYGSSSGSTGSAPKKNKVKSPAKKDSSCPKETKGSTCCAQGSPCKCAA